MPVMGVMTGIPGLLMMIICIRKYFFDLSGVDVFKSTQSTPRLQTGGLHQFVRHPLYFGTLLFIWSCFLLFPMWNNLIACLVITIYTIIGIKIEERKLIREFGDSYIIYSRNVPMLIPNLFKIRNNRLILQRTKEHS